MRSQRTGFFLHMLLTTEFIFCKPVDMKDRSKPSKQNTWWDSYTDNSSWAGSAKLEKLASVSFSLCFYVLYSWWLFVWLVGCSFFRSIVRSIVRSFVCLFVCFFVCIFCLFVFVFFVCLYVCLDVVFLLLILCKVFWRDLLHYWRSTVESKDDLDSVFPQVLRL